LGERHDLFALNAVVFSPGSGLLEHADDAVAGAPGERAQIAFLARKTDRRC